MKMPFGKHRDEDLDDIPISYLEWCLNNIEDLDPKLEEEMQNQISMRVLRQGIERKREE